VDVGGRRKGFHVAVIDRQRLVELGCGSTPEDVIRFLEPHSPARVAVDSPRRPAPDGLRSRRDEREFAARRICGIRYTPDRARLDGNPRYYEWIDNGLRLYAALEDAGLGAIECFPTASWTQWRGKRGTASRASWSSQALAGLGVEGVPARLNQDDRDAIAAAVTARLHADGRCFSCGQDLVVPA
jgi:predicted nuclease with RNAse H fold